MKRHSRILIFIVIGSVGILLGLLFVFFLNEPPIESPIDSQEFLSATVQIDDVILSVEVLDTVEERVRGLSGTEELPENRGMLFVHEEPGLHGYWMKGMLFSIDIIWIGEDLRVVEVAHTVSPDTYPQSFYPSQDALYVLETNAGWANKHRVQTGSTVTIYIP